MGQRQIKKFRKELRKEKQELFNMIMESIREMPFKERMAFAWKIIRKKC